MSCHTHGSTSVGLWVVACTMVSGLRVYFVCVQWSVSTLGSPGLGVCYILHSSTTLKKKKNASIKQKQKEKGSRR